MIPLPRTAAAGPPAGSERRSGPVVSALVAVLLMAPGLPVPPAAAQTSVKVATPSRLVLDAGGMAREVILEGAGLDQVRGFIVTDRSGRQLREVEGKILRAVDRGVRMELQAAASAPDVGELSLLLVTADSKVETPLALTVRAAAEPEPVFPPPATVGAGTLRVSIAEVMPEVAFPPPVTVSAGVVRITVARPAADAVFPDPMTVQAGTLRVTIARPGGDR